MNHLQVIFTTKRNRKSAIAFTTIGLLLIILIGDFAGSVVGYGITSFLFNVSNSTGFILLLTD
jgi:hypothetical protein